MAYVYILSCSDKSFYTGYTVDIDKRLEKHRAGMASKYTRARLPVELVYLEELENKIKAMQREAALKKLTRGQKERLSQEWLQKDTKKS